MPEAETVQKYLLIVSASILSFTIFLCLMRAALGPRFSDRIIAASIIGTKVIVLIAILALIIGENYLADICLIYAIINFLSVVVLARAVLEKKDEEDREKEGTL